MKVDISTKLDVDESDTYDNDLLKAGKEPDIKEEDKNANTLRTKSIRSAKACKLDHDNNLVTKTPHSGYARGI